ncbi:hypothetical protein [Streptomyces sp. NPDC002346]
MSAQYIDADGDTWTLDPESGAYTTRHVCDEFSLDEVRARYGPLAVKEEGSDRLVSEDEYTTESMLRRIIREELDRRFGRADA